MDCQRRLVLFRPGVAAWTRAALAALGVYRASINLLFLDDPAIRSLNRRHLGHDWPTDVITFPLSEPGDRALAGELVVSTETAAREAQERGLDPGRELGLYIVHGLLHLLGHDDQTESERAAMHHRQEAIVEQLGSTAWQDLIAG